MTEADTPAILILFGITGDLAQRKLLPALYHLFADGSLDERTVILGISRRSVTAEDVLKNIDLGADTPDQTALDKLTNSVRMFTMTQTDPAEYSQLKQLLDDIETEQGRDMHRLFYLSIPPRMFSTIIKNLGEQGLSSGRQHSTGMSRLLVEKPFGSDLASAQALIAETSAWFREDQIFRIDHYIAKDAVQNIVELRSESPEVEALWNSAHISNIEITVTEQLDIEGRVDFYEGVGALRDFVQSHLLQVHSLVTMDLPDDAGSEALHAARLAALQATIPLEGQAITTQATRGQYVGYRDEVGNPDARTETYAELKLAIANDRWQDTVITLKSGKAMNEKQAAVRILFRDDAAQTQSLTFHIQPESGVELNASSQDLQQLAPTLETFNAAHTASIHNPLGYEKIFLDAIAGDRRLFTTAAEILAAWRIVEGVISAWSQNDDGLILYDKGSQKISG